MGLALRVPLSQENQFSALKTTARFSEAKLSGAWLSVTIHGAMHEVFPKVLLLPRLTTRSSFRCSLIPAYRLHPASLHIDYVPSLSPVFSSESRLDVLH